MSVLMHQVRSRMDPEETIKAITHGTRLGPGDIFLVFKGKRKKVAAIFWISSSSDIERIL